MKLLALGIDSAEEAVYRYALQHPLCRAADVAEALGLATGTVLAAQAKLEGLTMIRVLDAGRLEALAPAKVIEQLIENRINELNAELRQVTAARLHIPSFEQAQRSPDEVEPVHKDFERIESLDTLRDRIDELSFFSSREIMAIQPGRALRPEAIEAARPLDRRCLRRGMRMRTLVYEGVFADEPTLRYFRELRGLGAEVRVSAEPMDRILIFDQTVAVVPIDPEASSRGAVIVRASGLIMQLIGLFDRLWANAVPLVPTAGAEGTDDEAVTLSPMEQTALKIMAEAEKDEIGARTMGVSLRTYRAYVAGVMNKLGSANRFQAALAARDRGLL